MSSPIQSRLLEHHYSLKFKHQPNNNHKKAVHGKAIKITLALIIAVFSFSAVGCSTLKALEPTAILISDIKNSI